MATQEKLVVVTGVTGIQGGSVARTFLSEPGWRVRGITRDATKPSAQHLRDAGIELVSADFDDPSTLVPALTGASAIFGVTDFWQFWATDESKTSAAKQGITINEVCYNRELEQSKNLIDAVEAVRAQDGSRLETFVLSTLSNTKKWSGGKYTWNLHFDGKAQAVEYLKATYPELARRTSYLQVGLYMENWKGSPFTRVSKREDGSYALRMPPVTMSFPALPFVHPPKDAGPLVRALVLSPSAPYGTVLVGYSTKATLGEWCEMWTRILRGRGLIGQHQDCKFDPTMTWEEWNSMLPEGLGKEIGDTYLYCSEFGYAGGDPEARGPEEVGVKMDDLYGLEKYMLEEDWTSIL